MPVPFSDDELLAYLDEMLPTERAAQCEQELRSSAELRQRVTLLIRRRDQGGHTVGEIWRRQRLSCLSRSELGSWLLGALDDGLADYVEFHLQVVGCRECAANLEDLQRTQAAAANEPNARRKRIFESSAGVLRSRRRE
jgi:anti-sigma factor RsiW